MLVEIAHVSFSAQLDDSTVCIKFGPETVSRRLHRSWNLLIGEVTVETWRSFVDHFGIIFVMLELVFFSFVNRA